MSKDLQLAIFRRLPIIVCAFSALLPASHLLAQDELGQQIFSACAACHGLNGRGGEHAPNIATEQNVQRMPDEALLAVVRNGIQAKGMPGFNKLLDGRQIRAVVQYLRVLQGSRSVATLPGSSDKGRKLFFGHSGCAECHMVNGRGGFFAADLSGYGSHSAAEIHEAIVSPDKNLNPRRGTVTVVTHDSKTYRGEVRNEDNFSLQMQALDGTFHLFDKTELFSIEHESKSLMPSDYGLKLSSSEIQDLIKFLSQGVGAQKTQSDDESQ